MAVRRLGRFRIMIVLSAMFVVADALVAATGASSAPKSGGGGESASRRAERSIDALRDDAQGKVFVSRRESTDVAGFIRTGASGDLLPDSSATTAGGKAQGFFARFGES